ncbi:MAG: hypothetical protein HYW47_01800 [Deltaproteobacteria bacterium]|nr:hypothetical protein [Deltaproteobacteria bacterium]
MKKVFFQISMMLYVSLTFVGCNWFDNDDSNDAPFLSTLGGIASRIHDMPHPFSQIKTTNVNNNEIFIKGTVSPDGSTFEDRAYKYKDQGNEYVEINFASSREDLGNGRQQFSQTLVSGPGGPVVPTDSVLIIGGITSKGISNTAEFYNPSENVIKSLGNLKVARYGHTVTEIKNSGTPLDGQFLVVGGMGVGQGLVRNELVSTIELFDPMTGTFSVLNAQLKVGREQHTATRLADGRVLITGGRTSSGVSNSGEIFDPATATFTEIPNAMADERVFHTALYLDNKTPTDSADDAVLLAGGQDSMGLVNDSADFFNPATGLFQPVNSMIPQPIYQHAATALPATSPHDAVLTGGMTKMPTFDESSSGVTLHITNQVVVFDYTHTSAGPDGFFTQTRDMLKKRAMHSTDSMGTNKLVILGGVDETALAHTTGEEYGF